MESTKIAGGLTDEQIIELYWKRNEAAISETDKKYHSYLYTIAYNVVHDELDSGDCLNDTYVRTWNKIPPARPNVFRAFLTKILRNSAVDKFRERSQKRHIPSEMLLSLEELEGCVDYSPSYEEAEAAAFIAEVINDFIKALPSRSEFIFVCRYFFADSVKSIAKMLALSESTVERELSKMRLSLKQLFNKEGYTV